MQRRCGESTNIAGANLHRSSSIVINRATELYRIKVVGEYMGFGDKKVQSGLLYSSMPEAITAFLKNGLTYTHVVNLAWLYRAYAEEIDTGGRPKRSAEEAYEMMNEYFKSSIVNRLKGKGTKYINDMLLAKAAEVKKQSAYLTGELFVIDEVAATKDRRAKIDRELTGAALTLLETGVAKFEDADLERVHVLLERVSQEIGTRAVGVVETDQPPTLDKALLAV